MIPFTPLRELPKKSNFKKGDLFILFGELFSRGYANGLVEEAKTAGMTLIGITVGRRDKENNLRPLDPNELREAEENLGGKIINIPLWAGFDMDAREGEPTPTEQLAKLKVKDWENFDLDWEKIKASKAVGIHRFIKSLRESMALVKQLIPQGSNIFFAHTMAGGMPRAKALLVLTNHVVKGQDKRYLSSQKYMDSNVGRLIKENMKEVTANTLKYLIDETADIRNMISAWGGDVCYSAYGYHGTEVLIGKKYQWQSYTPYLTGWGKLELENIAADAMKKGIQTVVFNCPEIRTNSSDIFSGVELSLYPLLTSLLNENGSQWAHKQNKMCSELLKGDVSLEKLLHEVDQYHSSKNIQEIYLDFENWPRHNSLETSELMLQTSDKMSRYNKSKKETITHYLSELVVQSTGTLIFNHVARAKDAVLWIGHDIISEELNQNHQS